MMIHIELATILNSDRKLHCVLEGAQISQKSRSTAMYHSFFVQQACGIFAFPPTQCQDFIQIFIQWDNNKSSGVLRTFLKNC